MVNYLGKNNYNVRRKKREFEKSKLFKASLAYQVRTRPEGTTVQDIADRNGASKSWVMAAKNDPAISEISEENLRDANKAIKTLYIKRNLEALQSMTPEKFDKSNLAQLAMVSGIFTDKSRLLEGLATDVIDINLKDSDISIELKSKLIEIDRIKKGHVVDGELIAESVEPEPVASPDESANLPQPGQDAG